ncbi:hypothetical protein Ais01nite_01230 [Asanoa ishikariensis]|uniref:Uncharacterized protein n=1 Tax=Asanoa ishikariensis TaxID=137265 RepID=A0A1H3TNN8_9ACTN|nr:DUF6300 family protein [Asanoa ishikariensis]GIF62088.1 hypothetical protein Ais01nite_01230 [Asanoa ishikariensis]SDZ51730.1 hypothetical protein SAMN05421684_6099 [Asanoa ishikariensis]
MTDLPGEPARVTFAVDVQNLRPCHRCGGDPYLAVTIPHATMSGNRTIPLCPRCDAADSVSHGLLAFFAVHSAVAESNTNVFQELARQWVAAKLQQPGTVTDDTFQTEVDAWRAGEFD